MPPFACRLLARDRRGWHGLTHRQLAERCGLARSTVAILSFRKTWNGLSVDVIQKFSTGCGVDLLAPNRAIHQIRSLKKPFLTKAPLAQRRFYLRLFKLAA
jgi:hypothetical protein